MTSAESIAGARTVAQMATYFEELEAAVRQLAGAASGSTRGYFTPEEDEEVRHLLVSYWQSRNALFELIQSCRSAVAQAPAERNAEFLVAYAAVILLVHAARFLGEQFEDRPIVRTKLNEPDPHFGIPARVYDTVRKSLTDPRHAWQLHQAMGYFQSQQNDLAIIAGDENFGPVWDLIGRWEHRLEVSAPRFAWTRLQYRVRQTWSLIRHDLAGRTIYGLQVLASRMASNVSTKPGHRPRLPDNVVAQLSSLVEPGDVFVTRKEHALTNYFLPGYWPHAVLYLGDGLDLDRLGIKDHEQVASRWQRLLAIDGRQPRRVLESMKDGVWIRSLESPFRSDAAVLLRPQLAEPEIADALARGLCHEGKPYDFDFDFTRSDRLVCTEVVYRSYHGIGGVEFSLTRRAGRWTLAAEDLLQMALDRNHFQPVAVFVPAHSDRLVVGSEVDELVQKTRGTDG